MDYVENRTFDEIMADRGQITGGVVDGPLAFDNAVAGNMLVKQLSYLAGALGAGIVLGARVPIMASCAVALVAARRGRPVAAP